ncbi:hypothetical protein Tco_1199594, partial [Tanacetum coccineum]
MAKSNDLYDVKICVRSSVKLLGEIKDLLERNRNRERLFRRTVFGPWLDILSHDNDNHLMHYVLQHQVYVSKIPSDSPPLIFHIGDHWLQFGRKEFCLITGFRFGFSDMDAVRVCLLIVAELVFMGKEDRNCIPRHIVSLVEDFDSWNDYPWDKDFGELNKQGRKLMVGKKEKDSNPNLELYATHVEKQTGWFIASIQFIKGLVDEDFNVSQDDGVGVVSGNCVDLQNNYVSAVSVLSANSHEGLNETRVANNDMLLLEGGDGFFYSEGGATNPESNKDKQPTLADVLDEVRALRKEVVLVKFDDARVSKLERLLNDNFIFRNDISPNGNHNVVNQGLSGSANHPRADGENDNPNGNQNGVNKGLSCSANDPLSTCSGANILDGEVVSALIGIHKADGNNDSSNVNHNAVNKALSCSANDPMVRIHKADGQNDIPNANDNAVNQGIYGSANDLMSTCSSLDMNNGEVAVAGMEIHKADGHNDIPNVNDDVINQQIIGSANDPMADGNNDYTYSQREPSTLDVLVQEFDSQKNHPGIDVIQHDTHVDCSIAKLNDHPTADIGVKVVP